MKKRFSISLLFLTLLAAGALSGCGRTRDAARPPEPVTIAAPVRPAELALRPDDAHPALMETADGAFLPDGTVTRAELRGCLAAVLDAAPEGAGLLPWDASDADGARDVTRGELSDILARLAEALSGEGRAAARALAEETAAGRTAPPEAAGMEDEAITRAELAVVLERLLGREPDEAGLLINGLLPSDVTPDDYAWPYIADAARQGRTPAAAPGVHRAYGWLYAVWDDGTLVTDMDYGVWTFGLDGRYTTGNDVLDDYLAEALELCGAGEMSDEEALEAAYLYVKYNYEYMILPEDMEELEVGAFGWEYERALRFFRYGGGPCYGYAAAFGLLARALGANAYIVSGEVNQYHGAHSFVVIPRDGVDLIYDVELEATRQERHPDLALFGIENYTIYNYWYETDWKSP